MTLTVLVNVNPWLKWNDQNKLLLNVNCKDGTNHMEELSWAAFYHSLWANTLFFLERIKWHANYCGWKGKNAQWTFSEFSIIYMQSCLSLMCKGASKWNIWLRKSLWSGAAKEKLLFCVWKNVASCLWSANNISHAQWWITQDVSTEHLCTI